MIEQTKLEPVVPPLSGTNCIKKYIETAALIALSYTLWYFTSEKRLNEDLGKHVEKFIPLLTTESLKLLVEIWRHLHNCCSKGRVEAKHEQTAPLLPSEKSDAEDMPDEEHHYATEWPTGNLKLCLFTCALKSAHKLSALTKNLKFKDVLGTLADFGVPVCIVTPIIETLKLNGMWRHNPEFFTAAFAGATIRPVINAIENAQSYRKKNFSDKPATISSEHSVEYFSQALAPKSSTEKSFSGWKLAYSVTKAGLTIAAFGTFMVAINDIFQINDDAKYPLLKLTLLATLVKTASSAVARATDWCGGTVSAACNWCCSMFGKRKLVKGDDETITYAYFDGPQYIKDLESDSDSEADQQTHDTLQP